MNTIVKPTPLVRTLKILLVTYSKMWILNCSLFVLVLNVIQGGKAESPPYFVDPVFSSVTIFSPDTPKRVRGIEGQVFEIPCGMLSLIPDDTIKLVKLSFERDEEVSPLTDSRIRTRYSHFENTFYFTIENAMKSDEGFYECTADSGTSSSLLVKILDAGETNYVHWDTTFKCGDHFTPGGHWAECDPLGAYPCCGDSNWCGYTTFHCECPECVDYRTEGVNATTEQTEPTTSVTTTTPIPTSITPEVTSYDVRRVSGKCLFVLDNTSVWLTADYKCRELGATLAIFSSVQEAYQTMTELLSNGMLSQEMKVWVGILNGTKSWNEFPVRQTDTLQVEFEDFVAPMCSFFPHENGFGPLFLEFNSEECRAGVVPLCECVGEKRGVPEKVEDEI